MKKIFPVISICLFMTMVMSGCEKNKREFFDTDYSALNIWLGTQDSPYETVTYNFITHEDMDAITFYFRLSGVPMDYDRVFTLEAVDGDVDKVDFVFGDYVLAAGEYQGSFPIYFAKPEDYDEFRDSDGYIVFKMTENSFFQQGAKSSGTNSVEMNRLYVIFQNSVTKPWNWDEDVSPYRALSYYFGTYSNVKYEFMIGALGVSDFRIKNSTDLTEEADNVISYLQAQYYVTKCQTALSTFNNDPGNIASGDAPLTDENGFPVTF